MYGGAPGWKFDYYSYEAYRRKYQDDIREVPRVTVMSLDQEELNRYVELLKRGKQRLATLDNESIYELMSIKRGEKVTLSATLLFSPYPQAYFPQLCITAIVIPGRTIGSLGDMGERFLDNQRIEGTIPEMLDEALLFVKRNMRTKTIISPTTGRRTDRTDYPITAVREAIINALVHRDYSIHTEGMPIQLIMFEDRIEIHNPGGLYGRQEEAGIWNLCLTHGDEKLHARLEEITSKWDVKKKFKTIESDDLAFDHELILADAIVQLRKWITETHIAFRLLPEKFTLRELQQIHETVLDTKLLVPAFRRKVADLVEDTGEMTGDVGHRPAKLYREKR